MIFGFIPFLIILRYYLDALQAGKGYEVRVSWPATVSPTAGVAGLVVDFDRRAAECCCVVINAQIPSIISLELEVGEISKARRAEFHRCALQSAPLLLQHAAVRGVNVRDSLPQEAAGHREDRVPGERCTGGR